MLYKVHFRLKETDYQLVANSLDLSHPYFVSIKDMDLSYEEGLVVNPHLENTKKRFKDTTTIMIPFQSVSLIESVPVKEKKSRSLSGAPQVVSMSEAAPAGYEPH